MYPLHDCDNDKFLLTSKIFRVANLHMGHVAKSFALRETPTEVVCVIIAIESMPRSFSVFESVEKVWGFHFARYVRDALPRPMLHSKTQHSVGLLAPRTESPVCPTLARQGIRRIAKLPPLATAGVIWSVSGRFP